MLIDYTWRAFTRRARRARGVLILCVRKLRAASLGTFSFLGSRINPMKFDQDQSIIAYNDVKKDVAKLFINRCARRQFPFVFLKDYENDIQFVN